MPAWFPIQTDGFGALASTTWGSPTLLEMERTGVVLLMSGPKASTPGSEGTATHPTPRIFDTETSDGPVTKIGGPADVPSKCSRSTAPSAGSVSHKALCTESSSM